MNGDQIIGLLKLSKHNLCLDACFQLYTRKVMHSRVLDSFVKCSTFIFKSH